MKLLARNLILACLCLPLVTTAQLSSPNYSVTNQGISAGSFTGNATSTNFEADGELGRVYVYDAPEDTSDGGSGGSTATGGDDEDTESTTEDPVEDESSEPPADDTEDATDPPVPPTSPADSDDGSDPNTSSEPDDDTTDGTSPSGGGDRDDPEPVVTTSTDTDDEEESAPETEPRTATAIAEVIAAPVRAAADAVRTFVDDVIASEPTKRVLQTVEPAVEPITEISQNEPVKTTAVTGSFILGLFGALRLPFSLSNVGRLLVHAWSSITGLVVFWKRRRAWGTVYDSVSKVPLDPAYVELFDEQGEKQAEAITDLDGRYGFLVPPGMYTLQVRKTNYAFPSHKPLRDPDVLYQDLYLGGEFKVTDSVTHDIPMDPVKVDWNQQEKLRTQQTRFIHRFDPILIKVLTVLFYGGAALAVWQAFVAPTLLNYLLVGVYAVLVLLRFIKGGPVLYGTVTKDGQPVPYAVVRVLNGEQVVSNKVADEFGRYTALVPPGTYTVRIEEPQADETYRTIFTGQVQSKNGVVNQRIAV